MNRIITISRQFGSGGETIGRELAERLGIPCYNKELIEKIAEQTGYTNDYIKKESEYAPNTGGFAYSFLGISQALMSVMTYLLNIIFVRVGENVF